MRHIIFGGGGVLGWGFRVALKGSETVLLQPHWSDPGQASRYIANSLAELLDHPTPTRIIWAAGIGQVGVAGETLATERMALDTVVRTISRLPEARSRDCSLIFASSGGALFGGQGDSVVGPQSEPKPISAYGFEKLVQEQVVKSLADQCEASVLVCRYSNIYGLAKGRLKPKGLVASAVRSARWHVPLPIFVSPDTRRDYLFNVDAAQISLALADANPGHATSLVASGYTMTVLEVLSVVGAISQRRVPATFAQRPYSELQPRTIRFGPPVSPVDHRLTPMAVGVKRLLDAPLQ